MVDVKIKRLYVSIGDHDTSKRDDHERVIQAEKIIIHLEYNPNNFQNDIGMKNDNVGPKDLFMTHFL